MTVVAQPLVVLTEAHRGNGVSVLVLPGAAADVLPKKDVDDEAVVFVRV